MIRDILRKLHLIEGIDPRNGADYPEMPNIPTQDDGGALGEAKGPSEPPDEEDCPQCGETRVVTWQNKGKPCEHCGFGSDIQDDGPYDFDDRDDSYADYAAADYAAYRTRGPMESIGEAAERHTLNLQVIEYAKLDPRSGQGTADGYCYDANDEEIPVQLEFDYSLAERDNGDADSWTPGPGHDTEVTLIRVTDENGIEIPVEDVQYDMDDLVIAVEEAAKDRIYGESTNEGAKVDRMVGHIKSSEKDLGKTDKEAENIAWATANKRGMLDNANKKTEGKDTMYDIKKGLQLLSEGVMFETGNDTLSHILNRFKAEVKAFQRGEDLDTELYEALFDYYSDQGEMPYGVAKARTGDPVEWVSQRLDDELNYKAPGSDITHGEELEADWHDADGNLDSAGAYDAAGHYDLERDAGREDYLQDDAAIPQIQPGEEIVTEGLEGLVTDILTNVGLDNGYDFFFSNGLIVIGRSTARVVINALKNDVRITAEPHIEAVDGEEVRIGFGQKQEKVEPTTNMVNNLAAVPELEEDGGLRYACPTCHTNTVTNTDGTCKLCGTLKEESMTGMNESINVSINAEDEDALDIIKKLSGVEAEVKTPSSVEVVDTASCAASPVASQSQGGDLAKLMGIFSEAKEDKEPIRSADREDDDDDTNWEEEDDLAESKEDRKDRGDKVYDNTPDEKTADISASIPSGNDLHKSKKMSNRGGLTGGDNPLEESLWAEYQAIKEGKADDLADKKAAEADDDWWGAKSKGKKEPAVKTVKGAAYGGSKQKDEVEKDEDTAPKKRGRPAKKK